MSSKYHQVFRKGPVFYLIFINDIADYTDILFRCLQAMSIFIKVFPQIGCCRGIE